METETNIAAASPSRAEFVERIKSHWHRSRESVLAIGRALIEAKKSLPHGDYTAMIEADLPFSPETARRFVRIAEDPKLEERSTLNVLPTSYAALDEIRRLDGEAVAVAIEAGTIHPDMTVRDARDLVQAVGVSRPAIPSIWNDPSKPANGAARSYAEFVWLAREARKANGLSHEDVDAIAGWQEGWSAALEDPGGHRGLCAVYERFNTWMKAARFEVIVRPIGGEIVS